MPLHEILLCANLSWVLKRAENFLLAGMFANLKAKILDQHILLETRISYHKSKPRGKVESHEIKISCSWP